MSIEVWGADEAGHLMLMPDPTPERTPTRATTPPPDEPPLAQEPEPEPEPAPAPAPPVETAHVDELRALRRLAEENRVRTDTMERLIRGEDLTPPTEAKPAPPVEPKSEDFGSHEEYVRAAARFEAKQEAATEVAALRQELQQERHAQQQAAAMEQLATRIRQTEAAFVKEHPDYNEVVTRGFAAKTPKGFQDFFMQVLGEKAAAVGYQVAQDEALLNRLLQMPPFSPTAAAALGELGAGVTPSAPALSPPPEETPPPAVRDTRPALPPVAGTTPGPASQVGRPKPAPPRPLGGSGATPPAGYRDDMPMHEYRQWRDGMKPQHRSR